MQCPFTRSCWLIPAPISLPALDEIRNALLEYLDFSFLSWATQQKANEFSEISTGTHVTMPSFVGMRWQVTSRIWLLPPICRCDIIFLVEISVVINPNNFQVKKKPFPSTFYNFCSFIFAISSCQSTHAIFLYMNSVNINIHKIKQNNWKINHHSTPLRICHNASDRVLTYGYFKSVCIDFHSLVTTSTHTLASDDLDALWYAYSHVHLTHIW